MKRAGVKCTNLRITNFFPKTKKPISKYTIGIELRDTSSKVSVVPFAAQCVDSLGHLSRHETAVWLD